MARGFHPAAGCYQDWVTRCTDTAKLTLDTASFSVYTESVHSYTTGQGKVVKEKRITVKVPQDLHHRIKVKSAIVGKSISDVVREYLAQWVEEDPPAEEETVNSKTNYVH
jgi:hypothetical protein